MTVTAMTEEDKQRQADDALMEAVAELGAVPASNLADKLPKFSQTDLGNGKRLAHWHGDKLRFVKGLGWFVSGWHALGS